MKEIDLFLDNDNSLDFNVSIESTKDVKANCRLMIENKDMSYAFPGSIENNGEVSIVIPSLKGILKEGKYNSILEIIVDDRIFKPLEFVTNFENSVSVQAEHVTRKRKPVIKATASFSNKKVINEKSKKQKGKNLISKQVNMIKRKLKDDNIDLSNLTESQIKKLYNETY